MTNILSLSPFSVITLCVNVLHATYLTKEGGNGGAIRVTHLFCGENRKTDQSSLVSHQSGLYTSNIFWTRKHKLCNEEHTETYQHERRGIPTLQRRPIPRKNIMSQKTHKRNGLFRSLLELFKRVKILCIETSRSVFQHYHL